MLFEVGVPAISKHLKNIFDEGELAESSVISKMETTASDGKVYNTQYYSLDAVISVGYRVNSHSSKALLQEDSEQDSLCCTWTHCSRTDS